MNVKSSMTPFSDSKLDNATEATQYFKQTPTDFKIDNSKQNQDLKIKDIKDKEIVVERKVIKQSSIIKPHAVPEVEKKLEIKSSNNKVVKEEDHYSEYDDVDEEIKIEIEKKSEASPVKSDTKSKEITTKIQINKAEEIKTQVTENIEVAIETPK